MALIDVTQETWYDIYQSACRLVKGGCKDAYAVAYATAALELGDDADVCHTQALYVLSNLGHWRGPDARKAKDMLREVCRYLERMGE